MRPTAISKRLRTAILAGIASLLPLLTPAAAQDLGNSDNGRQFSFSTPQQDNAPAESNSEGITTVELAAVTLEQLPDCLEYKIVGISLRLIIIPPFYYYYFWTPHVEHYSPDMVSLGHVELDEIPYVELNAMLGKTYKATSNQLFAAIVSRLFGMEHREIGGGRYQHGKWAEHQSVQFGENTVVGNPIAMFLDMFTFDMTTAAAKQTGMNNDTYGKGTGIGTNRGDSSGSGNGGMGGGGWGGANTNFSGSEGNGKTRPQVSEGQASSWMSSWISDPEGTEWPTLFSDSMGYQQVMTMMANSPAVQVIKQIMQQIDTALQSVNGRVGDSPFCPVNATPFEPYYLSGIDSYLWRMGYPVADSEYATTIMNPFSTDVVRPTLYKEQYGDALIDLPEEVESLLTPRWGHIYPREGALDDPNTARLATVLAKRSQTLLGESDRPIGRIYKRPKYRIRSAAWSRVWPDTTMCRRNIANTTNEELLEKRGRYAWNVWTAHNCDLYRKGIHIVTIPIGPIYVTPQIPE